MNEIKDIRFLPMAQYDEDFHNAEQLKKFLCETVVERGGVYNYYGKSIAMKGKTLVFFQYMNQLRACAVLIDNVKDENGKYNGHYVFDVDTIKFFNKPITKEEIKEIDPTFTRFSQSFRKTDLKYLDDLLELIKSHE